MISQYGGEEVWCFPNSFVLANIQLFHLTGNVDITEEIVG